MARVLVFGWVESAVVVVVAGGSEASALMLVVVFVGSRSLSKLGFGAVVVGGVVVVRHWVVFILGPFVAI